MYVGIEPMNDIQVIINGGNYLNETAGLLVSNLFDNTNDCYNIFELLAWRESVFIQLYI